MKDAEREFGLALRNSGLPFVKVYKYRDRQACPKCGNVLWKSEEKPDFLLGLTTLHVECKEAHSGGRWEFGDLSDIQREHFKAGYCWLFVLVGEGRVPQGRGAFLISGGKWLELEEKLLASGFKSVGFETKRVPGLIEIAPQYRLEWSKGKWVIPKGHPFWYSAIQMLQDTINFIEGDMDGSTDSYD